MPKRDFQDAVPQPGRPAVTVLAQYFWANTEGAQGAEAGVGVLKVSKVDQFWQRNGNIGITAQPGHRLGQQPGTHWNCL